MKTLETEDVLEGEYRGNHLLLIRQNPLDKFPFQFGVRKAKLILRHLAELKAFAEKYGSESL